MGIIIGTPGVQSRQQDFSRRIMEQPGGQLRAGTHTLDADNCADSTHAEFERVIRAGIVIGRLSSGLLGCSIIGSLTANAASGATTLTVTPAAAAELVRRIGASGTFNLRGAPTATGDVASEQVTYSAVNTTNGQITVTATTAAFHQDSFIQAEDGSETPTGIVAEHMGTRVTDEYNNEIDAQVPIVASGIVDQTQLIEWPANQAALGSWLMSQLSTNTNVAFDVQA